MATSLHTCICIKIFVKWYQYLDSAEVRREVNEGLNVVERWNGVNDFIFYGKGGELVLMLRSIFSLYFA
ncbi:MAG: hypothetical protein C6Y22_20705 [Hapalosiphonaceae cyanobacterium JJU2]|nr:MAG: hypothetical protein C6Y22_20705 [Hapalosiphonaceae cyanobacterium JJU2]